jgi:hypothetical protein
MEKNKHRGAITVYLSIILSAVIMLSGVLIDIVRIRAAEVQVKRAVSTAAISTLARYNTRLKEDYGLFALHNSDSFYLNEDVEDYLRKNLFADKRDLNAENQIYTFLKGIIIDNKYKNVDFLDLYDYSVERINVTPVYNFTENEVARQQMIEYMKYRAPVQFAENFMDKINYVAKTEKLTSAYKQKTVIEKKLRKIENAMNNLQQHINRINEFEKKSFDSSPASGSPLTKLCKNIILEEIYQVCRGADLGNSEESEENERASNMMERIDELHEDAEEQAEKYKDLLDEQLSDSLIAVKGALQELGNIQVISKQARQDINNLKAVLQEIKSQNKSGQINNPEMIAALHKDIEKYEKLLDTECSQNISADLNMNLELLRGLQKSVSELPAWIASESRQISSRSLRNLESSFEDGASLKIIDQPQFDSLMRKLTSNMKLKSMKEAAHSYEDIANILDKSISSKGKDPRKNTAEAAKKIRNEVQGAVLSPRKIENPTLLPSYFIHGSYPNKIFSEDLLPAEGINNTEPKVIEEFDADFNENSSFVEESFDYIIHFAQALKSNALDIRNEIYINEYILKSFKDVVEIADSSTDHKSNTTFFEKGEVEYIIGGNNNEEINIYLIKGQILLIRFGMNTLHIYSDSQKRLQALEIATAAAGLTGFGIPIVHNLIMCAWGTAEAIYDINDLYAGKKVPFIKTVDNWRTDLLPSGFKAKDDIQKEAGLMDFDYHDYLRLLLLVKDKEVKMNRIEDLIQLNLQLSNPDFKLNSCNTYIKVDVSVSIRYWFITKLFVPSKDKNLEGDRHIIHVEAWRGY